jgi:hypothetical protein
MGSMKAKNDSDGIGWSGHKNRSVALRLLLLESLAVGRLLSSRVYRAKRRDGAAFSPFFHRSLTVIQSVIVGQTGIVTSKPFQTKKSNVLFASHTLARNGLISY